MEFELNGIEYICREGKPEDLWHIVRRISPIVDGLISGQADVAIKSLTTFISKMDDKDADKIMFGLLKYIDRKLGKDTGIAPILNKETSKLMYSDITMNQMLQLWYKSFSVNLLPFIQALISEFNTKEILNQKDL